MKNCIHCGVSIKGSAVSFCPKCKKQLKKPVKSSHPASAKSKKPVVRPAVSRAQPSPKKKIPKMKKSAPPSKPKKKRGNLLKKKISRILVSLKSKKREKSDSKYVPIINPMDENYDGYYDDKPTDDNAQNTETLDPALIKRIALIAGGAIIIIILAIVAMQLL